MDLKIAFTLLIEQIGNEILKKKSCITKLYTAFLKW